MNRVDKLLSEMNESSGGFKVLKKYQSPNPLMVIIKPGDYLWPASPVRSYPDGDVWDIVRGGTFFGNERIRIAPQDVKKLVSDGTLEPTK